MRHLFLVAILGLVSSFAPPARAAESYDGCSKTITSIPVVVSTQGVWCLKSDVASSLTGGNLVNITSNNVTIDCNGFKIGGLGAGPTSSAVGIAAAGRLNIQVRGCNVRGFAAGIQITGGAGHVVEDNRLDGNLYRGIELWADASVIRRNLLVDTGSGTAEIPVAVINASGRVDVVDNMIEGVGPSLNSNQEYGILSGSGSSVIHNRIVGLHGGDAGTAYGIAPNAFHAVIEANHIYGGTDGVGSVGINCSSATTLAKDNIIRVTALGQVNTCTPSNNIYIP